MLCGNVVDVAAVVVVVVVVVVAVAAAPGSRATERGETSDNEAVGRRR